MARVTVLPPSEAIGYVDARQLEAGRDPPGVDAVTGAPSELRTFVVSVDPRVVVVPRFLTDCECGHLRELAEGQWSRSLVGQLARAEPEETAPESEAQPPEKDKHGDAGTGGSKILPRQAQTRTSSSCMLRPSQTSVLERIEHRLASLAKQPLENLERLVVVRYSPGEQFSEHHDGKFRPRTVFVYLNDLPEGDEGDTFFPHIGLSFVPRAGCAVMWTNPTPEGVEDSRMVHAGRPPLKAVKYGVNCFFNEERMRLVTQPEFLVDADEAFVADLRALGTEEDSKSPAEGRLRTFTLQTTPQVTAAPQFASEDEVEHILRLVEAGGPSENESGADGGGSCEGGTRFFAEGTVIVRTLEPAGTEVLARLEARLANLAHFPLEHLGRVRVVRGGTAYGLCNRGCGQRAALICLADRDEVFFPHLGLRLVLRRGDLIIWPNAWKTEPISDEPGARKRVVEDMRTSRVHLPGEGMSEAPLALDATFHDSPVSMRLAAAVAG